MSPPRPWRRSLTAAFVGLLPCGVSPTVVAQTVMAQPVEAMPSVAPLPPAPARPSSPDAEIIAPVATHSPLVAYPPGATGQERVELELEVARDGSAVRVEARSGREPFASAARQAVEAWRFTPATRNGLPVRARIVVIIHFTPPPAPTPVTALDAASPPASADAAATAEQAPIEVVVSAEERQELGAIHIPRHEARLVPGAFADPFRVVEVLPGVAPLLSGLPYFHVRGAPPGNVGYFIDNIRVPLLFHVGAGPSVLAPALVEKVDLFAGAYPARYGRYSGAIMAGETTEPSERPRGEAHARIFDAGGFVELPFDEARGSLVLAGRYSYTQALLAAVAPDFELGYWDYQLRASYRVAPEQRLSLFAFGALDQLSRKGRASPLFDARFHRLDARWDHETETSRTRASLTLGSDRVALTDDGPVAEGSEQESRLLSLALQTERRLSPAWRLRASLEAALEPYDIEREVRFDQDVDFGPRTDLRGSAHADVVYRPRRGVEIVPGLRFDEIKARGEWHDFWEPRLATRLRLAPGVAWESALGIAHQLPSVAIRTPARVANPFELLPQEAWQASESVEAALPVGLIGRFTLFHTWTDAEPLSSRNYGGEVFLRRDFTHRLGGFLSYTLSWANGTQGRSTFSTAYDRRHVLSLVLGYRLGNGFRLGGRMYYNSGRPFRLSCATPSCGPADPAAPRPFAVDGRFPSFLRADLRFEKRWELLDGRWLAATFEWFNAGLSRELDGVEWSPTQGGLSFSGESPLTLPSIGIEAGF